MAIYVSKTLTLRPSGTSLSKKGRYEKSGNLLE